ncbi:MAG: carboxylating nicotinate-nucleotide diphosphorylase [Bacteroidales bacterium]|jgi:nicotinate-nucleotide pyrophosphorylase (carboxylating)|nr:carboxylating nicotinate-nucleotide diphosphorylase [Bacteroidales bacterium]
MHIYSPESLIDLWFNEDIGEGDHTTLSTIPESAIGSAKLLVKENGILAGQEIAEKIFSKFDKDLEVSTHIKDGDSIKVDDIVLNVTGKVRSILQTERLVLNVMQRMSGIATETARYVKALEGTKTRVLDTRKTTPGFRYMEKEAVRIGGGVNHRIGLYDMIMIKDNHIDFAGGISKAVSSTIKYLSKNKLNLKIEVEVRIKKDIEEALRTGKVDRIMLDNFSIENTLEAVKLINGRVEIESSGGINFTTLRAYAECGVDFISVGALTHQIKSLDLSLKAEY